jgi:hypothetical protein
MSDTQNSSGWFGDFSSALMHHAGNPIYGGFQLWDNALTRALQAMAPGSQLANWSAGQTNAFNNVVDNRESSYQATTPTNTASLAGATLGELAPWALGAGASKFIPGLLGPFANGITRAGDAAASTPALASSPMAQIMANEGVKGMMFGAPQPITDSSNYWSDKGDQLWQWAAMGGLTGPIAGGPQFAPQIGDALTKWGQYLPVAQPLMGGFGL